MQISGTGHWFLEGWIGDHSVEFLVDSGSSVTAISNSLYQTLVRTVSGCSHCVVSFMGLQTEFPILVCELATGTYVIMGTDVLGSVLPHTLDIKNGLLFTEGGASIQLHRTAAFLRLATARYHPIQRLCSTAP